MTFAGPRKVTAPHDDEVDRWKVDITEEITALKQQPGGDLVAHGGPTFVHELSRRGIVDRYRLVVQPGAVGLGSPLFKDLGDTIVWNCCMRGHSLPRDRSRLPAAYHDTQLRAA